ncbi:MAG: component of SufBCD complex [Pseudomonadota bacterium]
MDWTQTVFELIDMRSFSNLWYWIALAVMWSTASHWVLGVPFDMVQRAGRYGGQAEIDLTDMVRINVNRVFYVVQYTGIWLSAATTGGLVALIILGWGYDVEFAQAVFLLAMPMTLVALLNVHTGSRIRATAAQGAQLRKIMQRHRFITQGLGVISIFITALWGMYQNLLVVGPLGG